MKRTKQDAKSIISSIRAFFTASDETPTPDKDKPAEGKFAGATAVYNITGAAPVYVDISDDNVPDIDTGDNVYADAAGTTPYPDGTYTVDATQFSFTVVAGVVTTVVDVAQTGPGMPVQQAAPPAQAAPAPQTQPGVPAQQAAPAQVMPQPGIPAPQVAPRFNIALPEAFTAFKGLFAEDAKEPIDLNKEGVYTDMLAMVGKFATGTLDERIANLEAMVKALMLYCFGYDIKRAEEQIAVAEAINSYKTTIGDLQLQAATQTKQIGEYKEAGVKLLDLFEEFLDIPTATPVTLNEKDKARFDKQAESDKRLDRIADELKAQRNKGKK